MDVRPRKWDEQNLFQSPNRTRFIALLSVITKIYCGRGRKPKSSTWAQLKIVVHTKTRRRPPTVTVFSLLRRIGSTSETCKNCQRKCLRKMPTSMEAAVGTLHRKKQGARTAFCYSPKTVAGANERQVVIVDGAEEVPNVGKKTPPGTTTATALTSTFEKLNFQSFLNSAWIQSITSSLSTNKKI